MPDTTATMPAAAKALFMNSYWNMSVMMVLVTMMAVIVRMLDALDIAAARHHEDMPAGAHNANLGAEQARQHRRGDDFIDGAEYRLAVAEIEHPISVPSNWLSSCALNSTVIL